MNEFRFAETGWLNAVWIVVLCAMALVGLELRGRSLLDRFLSPLMQQRLVRKLSLTRRLTGIGLFTLALLCVVLGLMRPQWGMNVQRLTRVESQIMICLDVSKSMLAEDVVPNRLERAKAEIDSLLGLMDSGQQVGLIAFAGKASVMCPMTTDFGFLRLILGEASPSAVGLGGTKIGDALQKAVAGFRDEGDVNRLVLLITDGEDHDSFPLDAAKLAREKGVRVVSIGFGDEAGSKIEMTDPRTGARSFVTDRNGVEVVSRLDGDTLREIALGTEGAYIPAGTGALDLQSIFDTHIKSLLRGSDTQEERVLRNEAYQWCVVAALALLISSLLVATSFGSLWGTSQPGKLTWGFLLLGLGVWAPMDLCAQSESVDSTGGIAEQTSSEASRNDPSKNGDSSGSLQGESAETLPAENLVGLPPREIYNAALNLIHSDPDRAEKYLTEARNAAGVDGELRFHSLYNLGWVEVARADRLLETEPEKALAHLEMSASRFREAIRVRSDSTDARHNLEIVARRILELRDALNQRNPQSIAERLDALIVSQRKHMAELQGATVRFSDRDVESKEARNLFRRLGVTQRQILSDTEKLAVDARQELTRLQSELSQASTSQGGGTGQAGGTGQGGGSASGTSAAGSHAEAPQIRVVQLAAMLPYLDSSVQRMGRARGLTRRLQADSAFLRWVAALSDAKRGRDQLRDPIEVLGILIEDSMELARLTQRLSQRPIDLEPSIKDPGSGQSSDLPRQSPAWLTLDLVTEMQQATSERTQELHRILAAGVTQAAAETNAGNPAGAEKQMQDFLASVEEALPFVEEANELFDQAAGDLAAEKVATAFERQSKAIVALMDAAEFFYDLRRLIEVLYRDELMVQALVDELASSDPNAEGPIEAVATSAAELQLKNLGRSKRLGKLLQREVDALVERGLGTERSQIPNGATAGGGVPTDPRQDPEQLKAQVDRLETAQSLVVRIEADLQSASEMLDERPGHMDAAPVTDDGSTLPNADTGLEEGEQDVADVSRDAELSDQDSAIGELPTEEIERAVRDIEELRRLFFSVLEHLRETAQRQSELNDDSRESSAIGKEDGLQFGPLKSRQSNLAAVSDEIARSLSEQSEQMQQQQLEAPAGSQPPQQAEQAAETLVEASELVSEARLAMNLAMVEMDSTQSPSTGPDGTLPGTDTERTRDDDQDVVAQDSATEPKREPVESSEDARDSDLSADESTSQDAAGRLPWQEVFEHQEEALQKLLEALKRLEDQQSGQEQDDSSGTQDDSPQDQPQTQPQQPQNMNAEQMLQAIRDREAQRRKAKQAQALGSGGVEKDW